MNLIDLLGEPLQHTFMQRALLVALVASVLCAVLSCWLVIIGWSLMGDAVSHAVLPGVALAYILGAPFALGAFVFGLGAVGAIGVIRDRSKVKEDAAIGVVFTSLFALGVVLISVTPSSVDLTHILFGNLLGISEIDMWQVLLLGAVGMAVLLAKRRDLTLFAFDPSHAQTMGINPRRLSALLLVVLALTVVVALQAVGVVMVIALLITPGATAYLLTDKFSRMLVLAPIIAAACAIVGIYASYYLDAASGGMVVLTQGVTFLLAFLFAPHGGVITHLIHHRRPAPAVAEVSNA